MIVGQWIKRKKWSNTRDRILVGISLLDILFSVALGIGTAATPPDFIGVVGAMGNTELCDFQGFLIQLGMAVQLYYCGLSLVFLLHVIKGKNVRKITTHVEPIIHVVVWITALSTAITGLVLGLYNSNGQFCYIKPHPYNCEYYYEPMNVCTRGEMGIVLVYFFSVALVGLPYLGTIILMVWLYYAVWNQDRKLRGRYGDLWNGNMDRLQKIKTQAFVYIGGYFFVWIWTAVRVFLTGIGVESPFWLEVVATVTLPLQGLFNFLAFVRQPIAETKKSFPDQSWPWVAFRAVS